MIPIPKFEILPTNNILVTIPAEEGLDLIIFHGTTNRKIKVRETGDYIRTMIKNANNDWTFELINNYNESDIIYYWLYAQYKGDNLWQQEIMHIDLKTIIQKYYDINVTISPEKCTKTITTITNSTKQICKDHLIFEDTFDIYDTTKWQREIKFNGYDGEFVIYENKSDNLYIKDGNLHIVPTLTNETVYKKIIGINDIVDLGIRCTEEEQRHYFCQRNAEYRFLPPITSAKIRTKETFSFRYGRIDVRAKLPKGDWIFPQIFLEPLKNNYANQQNHEYLAGQMRIAFIHGNVFLRQRLTRKYYHGSILYGGIILHDFEEMFLRPNIRPEHLGNSFHIYTIIWTDEDIQLYLDNNFYGKIDNSLSHNIPQELLINDDINFEPFQQPFYISLGVGVGGNMNFPDNVRTMNNIEKPWQNDEPQSETNFWLTCDEWKKTWNNHELKVDYVRVWAV